MTTLSNSQRANLETRRRNLIAQAGGRPMTAEQNDELHSIIGTLARDDARRAERRCVREAA